MVLTGLEEDSRFPYVVEAAGYAVGVLTLQAGAARLAGLGPLAATSAVAAAAKLTARRGTREAGVVLSVNEANAAGLSAYRTAGFVDQGQYLGSSSGPQRTMFHSFTQ
jgi:hypothetical protein